MERDFNSLIKNRCIFYSYDSTMLNDFYTFAYNCPSVVCLPQSFTDIHGNRAALTHKCMKTVVHFL